MNAPTDDELDARYTAVYDDILTRDGRSLVMDGVHVMLLSEVSSSVLRHAEAGVTVRALSDALVEEFGPPPGGTDAVAATLGLIATLEERGLLSRIA